MASYENFYGGGSSGLNPVSGSSPGYLAETSNIGFPTDAITANALKNVASKIRTGAKVIEVSGLGLGGGGPMKTLASIPKQHWKEIDRLRKLTGVELTFHGPLVEPTGIPQRGNWSEDSRLETESQMKSAVDLAQKMDPNGNVIVTFHSSNGLPEPERTIKTKDGEEVVQMAIINERTGELGNLPFSKEDWFRGGETLTPKKQLDALNNTQWTDRIESIVLANNRARKEIEEALQVQGKTSIDAKSVSDLHFKSKVDPRGFENDIQQIAKSDPTAANILQNNLRKLDDASFFVEDAFLKMKEAYNTAYDSALRDGDENAKKILESRRVPLINTFNAFNQGQATSADVSAEINKTAQRLDLLGKDGFTKTPQLFRPLRKWAIDKSSDSFANTALHGLKKFGNNAPIISIENPPVGMGLTRGADLRDLVKASREKFVKKAVETGMSKSVAKKQAEKLLGVTWDTGHINSLRKYGYDEADVVGEAKKVAPFVKHVHAVDNLGFEDSELPPGMGNVPFDKILTSHPNFKKAKKIIEASDWFLRASLGQTGTPIRQAYSGLGSSIYGNMDYPTWGQATDAYGAYFSGLGDINPQVHHSIYGAGFTNLPADLGGPSAGGQSRFSGAPIE